MHTLTTSPFTRYMYIASVVMFVFSWSSRTECFICDSGRVLCVYKLCVVTNKDNFAAHMQRLLYIESVFLLRYKHGGHIHQCSVHQLENFLQHATLFCKAILYIHCAIVCVRIMSDKSNINFTITTQVSTKTNTTTNNKGFSVSADFGHDVRVFYQPSHHQLPTELFAGVGKVREGRPHQRGPEDNGEVRGGHLVDVLLQLDLVQVEDEVAERGEVG